MTLPASAALLLCSFKLSLILFCHYENHQAIEVKNVTQHSYGKNSGLIPKHGEI